MKLCLTFTQPKDSSQQQEQQQQNDFDHSDDGDGDGDDDDETYQLQIRKLFLDDAAVFFISIILLTISCLFSIPSSVRW